MAGPYRIVRTRVFNDVFDIIDEVRLVMPVLVAVLQSLRSLVHSHAVLHLELLALRHQLQVLKRSSPRRVRLSVAPTGISAVLDLEKPPPQRPAEDDD